MGSGSLAGDSFHRFLLPNKTYADIKKKKKKKKERSCFLQQRGESWRTLCYVKYARCRKTNRNELIYMWNLKA
jgi:hypothetical protein